MTLFVVDCSRHQVERPDALDLAKARAAGMNAVNIQLDRGRQEDVLPGWASEYAEGARSLGLLASSYRWLDARIAGAESARRAFERMQQLGLADAPHTVDCEDTATEQHLRDYVTTMTGLLGRPIAIYSGRWYLQPRGWKVNGLSPYLWAAPSVGYLTEYPGDDSPHWTVAYGGYTTLAAMQYAVAPLPDTGLCSLSAIRDPAVWTALTGGSMARPNPNPARISAPLWWLVCTATDDTPTAFAAEQGGTWAQQPGSHSDAAWLKANRPNDYSLRGAKQQNGPQQYGRAWDWTFPSAQRGDWSEIGVYSLRVKKAWETNDPRMFGVFEILCQTPEDKQPEGYVFYPDKLFRVPDSSHEWHMHLGILTQYINDQAAMEALWSVLSGESLAAWRARTATTSQGDDDMIRVLAVTDPSNGNIAYFGAVAGRPLVSIENGDQLKDWRAMANAARAGGEVPVPPAYLKAFEGELFEGEVVEGGPVLGGEQLVGLIAGAITAKIPAIVAAVNDDAAERAKE